MNKSILAKVVWLVAAVAIPTAVVVLRPSQAREAAPVPPSADAMRVSIPAYTPVVVELGQSGELKFGASPTASAEPLKPELPVVFREGAIVVKGTNDPKPQALAAGASPQPASEATIAAPKAAP